MATRGGGAPRSGGRSGRPNPSRKTGQPGKAGTQRPAGAGQAGRSGRHTPPPQRGAAGDPSLPPGPFRLGAVPGATPGRWIDRWNERMPAHPVILETVAVADQRAALDRLDAAFVRLPIDREGLHVISLYDEVPVVVVPAGSDLTAADDLSLADLAGEVVIRPQDDAMGVDVPGAAGARFAPPATTEDAIAIVASGIGVVIVPMSLARLHRRRDAALRELTDGPTSTIALAWPAERTTPAVEAFVGVVRGRTARSSRG